MTVTDNTFTKQAFHLIRQFLKDHGLHGTVEMLESEISEHDMNELSSVVLPHNKPLIAILEQHDMLYTQERMNNVALKQATTLLDTIGASGNVTTWKEMPSVFKNVHNSNILCSLMIRVLLPAVSSCGFPNAMMKEPILLTGSTDKSICMTHAETGDLLHTFDCFLAAVLSLASYPPNPRYLLATSMDGSHAILDLVKKSVIQHWKDHSKYVNRALFSEDGEYFVTGSYDKSINIYKRLSVDSGPIGGPLDSPPPQFEKAHSIHFEGAVESIVIVPAPASADVNETPDQAAFAPRVVVGVREDNYLHYINLINPESRVKYNMNANGDDWVSFTPMDMCLSPDPSHSFLLVYTDSSAGRLLIFNAYSGDILKEYWGTKMDPLSQPRCAWDPSGKYIYATSDDFSIHVIDVVSGEVTQKLVGHDGIVRSIGFSDDGECLVSASYDKSVRVWKRDGASSDEYEMVVPDDE